MLITIAIFITLCFIYNSFNETYTNHKLNISLCVPCHPPHKKHLKQLLNQVNMQTSFPYEIVISLSETSQKEGVQLQQDLQKLVKVPLKICTLEGKAYAGENRNNTAKHAKGNILSFMDADDKMHPQRLEILETIFKRSPRNIYAIVHMYTTGSLKDAIQISSKDIINEKVIFKEHLREKEIRLTKWDYEWNDKLEAYTGIHHGHITIYKDKYDKVLQKNNEKRGQDAIFLRDCLDKYKGGILLCKRALSKYTPWID